MTMPLSGHDKSAVNKRYRIVVKGEFGDLLSTAFEDVYVRTGGETTVLEATVSDEQQLFGLVDRLRDFAISIVSIHQLDEGGDPLTPA